MNQGHAEVVTSDQLAVEDKLSFYLPMHAVVKQSSTTTSCALFLMRPRAQQVANASVNHISSK